MVTLERERMPVSAQGNGGVEVQPQPHSVNQEVVVFQKVRVNKTRAEKVEAKRQLVEEAWEKGWNTQLTGRQSLVLERYRNPNSNGNGRILSLRGLAQRLKDSGDNITCSALSDHEIRAFRKLEAIKKKEKEQQKEDLGTVHQIMEQSDIKKKKRGRPLNAITINDPVSALFIIRHFREQGFSHRKIAEMTGLTERIVEYRLRKSES